ncbi:MAG: dihydrofolate reductase [Candidatus Magasanikbacteria bacterium]|nr:dihydrofolate reductase [Candidatus Magasanikbacteria bacterium]
MPLSLIAAIAKNNCIGKSNALPWYLPEDLKHFKKLTTGKIVLMGRKTWESIPEKFRPLPNRLNIVVTHQANIKFTPGVEVYHTIDDAMAAHLNDEIMVIGGGEIYRQTFERAATLYITEVHQNVDGDVFFPEIDKKIWRETERENHETFSFVTYERVITRSEERATS